MRNHKHVGTAIESNHGSGSTWTIYLQVPNQSDICANEHSVCNFQNSSTMYQYSKIWKLSLVPFYWNTTNKCIESTKLHALLESARPKTVDYHLHEESQASRCSYRIKPWQWVKMDSIFASTVTGNICTVQKNWNEIVEIKFLPQKWTQPEPWPNFKCCTQWYEAAGAKTIKRKQQRYISSPQKINNEMDRWSNKTTWNERYRWTNKTWNFWNYSSITIFLHESGLSPDIVPWSV
jgi:hypothetical protein